jgi:hypothetical protein
MKHLFFPQNLGQSWVIRMGILCPVTVNTSKALSTETLKIDLPYIVKTLSGNIVLYTTQNMSPQMHRPGLVFEYIVQVCSLNA